MIKAKVIRGEEIEWEPGIEPPLKNQRGINSKTVEKPRLVMNHTIVPPGGRNQRHYHVYTDAGYYVMKGRLTVFLGPDHEMEEVLVKEGDFVFVPAGAIHGLVNLSKTETVELVTTACGVSSIEDLGKGTVFVEPRWDK
jgi:quercetin dioxygenase-like cupin family protein